MPTPNLVQGVELHVLRRALVSVLLLTACGDDAGLTPSDESTGTGDISSGNPSTSPSTTMTPVDPTTTGATDGVSTGSEETTMGAETETEGPGTTSVEECGNGIIEGSEECDGKDLGGADCESEGFDGGELSCAGCEFDAGGCVMVTCGDGVVEGNEACDGDELGDATCVSQGFDGGELACDDGCAVFDTSGCVEFACGNDVAEGSEACDGDDLAGESCASQGEGAGTIVCLDDCTGFDVEGCSLTACIEEDLGNAIGMTVAVGTTVGDDEDLAQACGNGGAVDRVLSWTAPNDGVFSIDSSGSDYDTVLALHTDCGSTAFACNDNTEDFTSRVYTGALTGESVIIAVSGYGGAVGNYAVSIEQFDGGGPCCGADYTVGCSDDPCTGEICAADPYCCNTAWDTLCRDAALNNCEICDAVDVCGNNITEEGESCDGLDLAGQTCATLGYDAGTLLCAEDCSGPDLATCIAYEGDCCTPHGADEPGCGEDACWAEVCAIDSSCCADTWDDACAELAIANCEVCFVPDVCGNYLIDGDAEVCDRTDVGGETCVSQGFDFGTLGCAMDCTTFDTAGCSVFTGDCCADDGSTAAGCEDDACRVAVCAEDPYCCTNSWDSACVNEGLGLCSVCGGGLGDCCTETGDVGCNDADCVETICGAGGYDPTCCNTDWTAACTDLATMYCPLCF
jgi:hypothetical protein